MEVPQAAVMLAKRFEGFHRVPKNDPGRAYPYVCPAGYHTIGFGHLCQPDHPPVTEAEAEAYLVVDLRRALTATLRYCPVLSTEPEWRLAAIVDFTFNLGAGRLQTSTLRRRVNQRNWLGAGQELRRWVYGGGKALPGLVMRREAEALQLLNESTFRQESKILEHFELVVNTVSMEEAVASEPKAA
jgi:lysozyme